MRIALPLAFAFALSGCATAMVTGAVVGTTAKVGVFAVKTTAKAAVGTGKLVYRGAKAVLSDDCDEVDCERPH